MDCVIAMRKEVDKGRRHCGQRTHPTCTLLFFSFFLFFYCWPWLLASVGEDERGKMEAMASICSFGSAGLGVYLCAVCSRAGGWLQARVFHYCMLLEVIGIAS